jgi:endogenous inhibitor of DNA gyrase (YacG/DUF329 family)
MIEAFDLEVQCATCSTQFLVFGQRHRDPFVLRGFTVVCPECKGSVHSHVTGNVIPETVSFRMPIEAASPPPENPAR